MNSFLLDLIDHSSFLPAFPFVQLSLVWAQTWPVLHSVLKKGSQLLQEHLSFSLLVCLFLTSPMCLSVCILSGYCENSTVLSHASPFSFYLLLSSETV